MNENTLLLFVTTFFFVSITPGICMTLALSLGMVVGYKKTLWMITGALLGLIFISLSTCLGVAAIFQQNPSVFLALKSLGGIYLCFIGWQMWTTSTNTTDYRGLSDAGSLSRKDLFSKGLLSVVANPKGWAFYVSLLPPFVNQNEPLLSQLLILIPIVLVLEFAAMSLYAAGGGELKRLVGMAGNVVLLNRISGTLIVAVGIWLLLS